VLEPAPVNPAGARKPGRNEAIFREVNERLRELGEGFSVVAERGEFVCECGDEACAEPIQLTLEEYERVRSDSRWFVLLREHVRPQIERVVWEIDERLVVVEKKPGPAADEAVAEDPRR
jgi:hypothetical protein